MQFKNEGFLDEFKTELEFCDLDVLFLAPHV